MLSENGNPLKQIIDISGRELSHSGHGYCGAAKRRKTLTSTIQRYGCVQLLAIYSDDDDDDANGDDNDELEKNTISYTTICLATSVC